MAIFYPSGSGSSVDLDVITTEAGDILAGKTGIDPEGDPLPGTMTDRTNMGKSPGISNSYPTTPVHIGTYPQVNVATNGNQYLAICPPRGFYPGGGGAYIGVLASEISSIPALTPANAVAAHILNGETAWVNGVLVRGTLQVQSAINFNIAAVSYNSIRISWTNPAVGPWAGVFIQMSTGGYPGQQGGSRVYTGVGSNAAAGAYSEVIIGGLSANTTYYFTCSSYADPLPWGAGVNLSARTADSKVYVANNAVIGTDTTFGPFVIDERCHLHVSYYYDSGGNYDRRKWFMGRGPTNGGIGFIGDSPFHSADHRYAETIYGDAGQSGDLSWDLPSYMGQTFYICFMPSSDTDHRNLTINYIYYDIV